MKYSMDSLEEFSRLNRQVNMRNYSVENEMCFFSLENKDRILDAGCGSGLLIDYIKSLHCKASLYGIDLSSIRIQQLKEKYRNEVNLKQANIELLPFEDNYFDRVFNRYVLEHLENPHLAIQQFYRVLRPGGTLSLIDIDGILFNISTKNAILKSYLIKLQEKFKFNLYIGRDLKLLMIQSGFEDIRMRVDPMFFEGEQLELEKENYIERFENAKEVITDILGTEKDYRLFKTLYLESLNEVGFIFYNKFLLEGTKP